MGLNKEITDSYYVTDSRWKFEATLSKLSRRSSATGLAAKVSVDTPLLSTSHPSFLIDIF